MPTNYPNALDVLINNFNANSFMTNHPESHDNLADAVMAIQAELGIRPSGSYADLASRLSAISPGFSGNYASPQEAVDAAPDGGTVILKPGDSPITTPLVISKNLNLVGSGISSPLGAAAASANGSGPLIAPYLKGSVLVQSGVGQDGIQITGTGITVNIRDLGIRFADAIKFRTTGHGIIAQAPVVTLGHDLSIVNSRWDNIAVYGHDGNHYGYRIVNQLMNTLSHLRAWGGGGFHFKGDGDVVLTGNSTVEHPYIWMFAGGSAHAYLLEARTPNSLNLMVIRRPQVLATAVPPEVAGLGVPSISAAQYMFRPIGGVSRVVVEDPDFEGFDFDNPIDFTGTSAADILVRPGGFMGGPDVTVVPFATEGLAENAVENFTLTAGPGAGVTTGGVASRPLGGNDNDGMIRIQTGTVPAGAGNLICSVRFKKTGPRFSIILKETNDNITPGLTYFPYNVNGNFNTGFDVYSNTALGASKTYDFFYSVRKAVP